MLLWLIEPDVFQMPQLINTFPLGASNFTIFPMLRILILLMLLFFSKSVVGQDSLYREVLHQKVMKNWPKKTIRYKEGKNHINKLDYTFDKKTRMLHSVTNIIKDSTFEFFYINNGLVIARFHVFLKKNRRPIQSGWYYFDSSKLVATRGTAPTTGGEVSLLLMKSKELFNDSEKILQKLLNP